MATTEMDPKVLRQMLQAQVDDQFHRYATRFDDSVNKGNSPNDLSIKKHDAVFEMLSEPLKRMQVDYLKKVSSQCYKDKHMSEDAPNEEQINLCRNRVHQRIFGKFVNRLVNLRDSNQFKLSDCLNEAGNDVVKAVHCVRNYNSGIDKDNESLVAYFQSTPELSKYL